MGYRYMHCIICIYFNIFRLGVALLKFCPNTRVHMYMYRYMSEIDCRCMRGQLERAGCLRQYTGVIMRWNGKGVSTGFMMKTDKFTTHNYIGVIISDLITSV